MICFLYRFVSRFMKLINCFAKKILMVFTSPDVYYKDLGEFKPGFSLLVKVLSFSIKAQQANRHLVWYYFYFHIVYKLRKTQKMCSELKGNPKCRKLKQNWRFQDSFDAQMTEWMNECKEIKKLFHFSQKNDENASGPRAV